MVLDFSRGIDLPRQGLLQHATTRRFDLGPGGVEPLAEDGLSNPGQLQRMVSEVRPWRYREKVQWRNGKATIAIRYTSDSHGRGVHKAQPVANEPFSWVEAGRDQHSSQHFALEGAPTDGLG
jgi:hypothetical protein